MGASRFAKATGTILVLLSIAFLAVLIWSQREILLAFRPTPLDLVALAANALVYGALNASIAVAWWMILVWTGESGVALRDAMRVFCTSQITKYLPGNLMQIGRQVAGRHAGWSHLGSLLSSVFELLTQLSAAGTVVVIGIIAAGLHFNNLGLPLLVIALVGFICTGALVVRLLPRILERRWPVSSARIKQLKLAKLFFPYLIYLSFFLSGGLILLSVAYVVVGPIGPRAWPPILCLYASAWIAGTFTPGAPAGVGIREAVLTIGMSGFIAPGQAVLIAGLLRLITVTGDVVAFLIFGWRRAPTGRR
jgi:hypothetical protein